MKILNKILSKFGNKKSDKHKCGCRCSECKSERIQQAMTTQKEIEQIAKEIVSETLEKIDQELEDIVIKAEVIHVKESDDESRECEKEPLIQDNVEQKDHSLCSKEGCTSQAKRKGMCNKHYLEYYKAEVEPNKPICVIEGCTRHSRTRGLCKCHYEYLQKRGVFKKFPEGLRPEALNEIYYEYTKKSK